MPIRSPDPSSWSSPSSGLGRSSGLGLNRPGRTPTFSMKVGGQNPPVASGSPLQQLKQATILAGLVSSAEQSVHSHGRLPTDFFVRAQLRALSPTPVASDVGRHSVTEYGSEIPSVLPAQVYEAFVGRPNDFLGGAGLRVRPRAEALQNGARLMLEDASKTPALWFPVEVVLDPARRRVSFQTLDGHPLRGINAFHFDPDGTGGTKVTQTSRFQSSSAVTSLGARLTDALEHQHRVWKDVHTRLFHHFYPAR